MVTKYVVKEVISYQFADPGRIWEALQTVGFSVQAIEHSVVGTDPWRCLAAE